MARPSAHRSSRRKQRGKSWFPALSVAVLIAALLIVTPPPPTSANFLDTIGDVFQGVAQDVAGLIKQAFTVLQSIQFPPLDRNVPARTLLAVDAVDAVEKSLGAAQSEAVGVIGSAAGIGGVVVNQLKNVASGAGFNASSLIQGIAEKAGVGERVGNILGNAVGGAGNIIKSVLGNKLKDMVNEVKNGLLGSNPYEPNASAPNHTAVPLRRNPLDGLNYYDDIPRYNPTSVDYWASVAWTGIWGYVIGLTLGLFLLCCMVASCWICCRDKKGEPKLGAKEPSDKAFKIISLVSLFLLLVALAGCGVVWYSYSVYKPELDDISNTVLSASTNITNELYDLSKALNTTAAALPGSAGEAVLSTSGTISQAADNVKYQIDKGIAGPYNDFKLGWSIGMVALAACVAATFVVGILIFLFTRSIVTPHIWIFFWGLVLAGISWILAGVAYAFWQFVVDSCNTAADYLTNPQGSDIKNLFDCTSAIPENNATYIVNGALKLLNLLAPVAGAIDGKLNNVDGVLSSVLGNLQCAAGTGVQCLLEIVPGEQPIADNVIKYVLATRSIIGILPTADYLLRCTPVTETVQVLYDNNCPNLKYGIQLNYIGLVVLSVALFFLPFLHFYGMRHNSKTRKYADAQAYYGDDSKKDSKGPQDGKDVEEGGFMVAAAPSAAAAEGAIPAAAIGGGIAAGAVASNDNGSVAYYEPGTKPSKGSYPSGYNPSNVVEYRPPSAASGSSYNPVQVQAASPATSAAAAPTVAYAPYAPPPPQPQAPVGL